MVMHSRLSGQRGFMTAESLMSLFFYIVMVAAIAGVGAMVMTKTSGAKGAAALSIARANVIGQANIMDYAEAANLPVDQATHRLASAAGVIPGVGTMSFVGMPAAPTRIAINVADITDPDVCRAVGSVGFGTWTAVGMQDAAITASGSIAATAAAVASSTGAITAGAISTKATLEATCSQIREAHPATLVFITK